MPEQLPPAPFTRRDSMEQARERLEKARAPEQEGNTLEAWRWYEAALFLLPESAPEAETIRNRVARFSSDERLLRGAKRQFAEAALLRAEHFLGLRKKKWPLIAHYLRVAAGSAEEGTETQARAQRLLREHRQSLPGK